MRLRRTILVCTDNVATDRSTLEWHLRDQLDGAWRAYGQAALELRSTMRADLSSGSRKHPLGRLKNRDRLRESELSFDTLIITVTFAVARAG